MGTFEEISRRVDGAAGILGTHCGAGPLYHAFFPRASDSSRRKRTDTPGARFHSGTWTATVELGQESAFSPVVRGEVNAAVARRRERRCDRAHSVLLSKPHSHEDHLPPIEVTGGAGRITVLIQSKASKMLDHPKPQRRAAGLPKKTESRAYRTEAGEQAGTLAQVKLHAAVRHHRTAAMPAMTFRTPGSAAAHEDRQNAKPVYAGGRTPDYGAAKFILCAARARPRASTNIIPGPRETIS